MTDLGLIIIWLYRPWLCPLQSPENTLIFYTEMQKRGTVCSIFKSRALAKPEKDKMILAVPR